jgi:shikimate kinase
MPIAPPPLDVNLVLIGGRGAGKSSIARRILRREPRLLILPLDSLIQYESRATIPEIVAKRGWRHFRDVEARIVRKAAAFRGALVDAGGGVVVDLDAREREVFSRRKVAALRRRGLVVYLRRDVGYLLRRIKGDARRPTLSARESFEALLKRREPWYRRAAHRVLECRDKSKDALADEILSWFYRELRRRQRRPTIR